MSHPEIPSLKSKSSNKSVDPPPRSHHLNPPDSVNPDAATLRDQWKYATRQYSRWYSQAWGTAILAGLSFFALGWIIKGSNPLSVKSQDKTSDKDKAHQS